MKRQSLITCGVLGLASVHAAPLALPTVEMAFSPSAEDFPNPERGFYHAGGSDLARLDRAFFDRVFADGYRLV